MENNLNKSFYRNIGWGFLERFGAQAILLVLNIVLARKLLPSDYGIIATAEAIVLILQTVIDCGFRNALIQKDCADEDFFSTALLFSLAVSAVLYFLLFLFAGAVGEFYRSTQLAPVLRVMGLSLIFFGVRNTVTAYISKMLIFRNFFYATLAATLFSSGLALFLAFQGAGFWALAAQHLSDMVINTLVLCSIVKWRPEFRFSPEKFREMLSFGWRYLVSSLVKTLYDNLRSLIIGKKYMAVQLGYFYKGEKFPSVIVTNINNPIGSVLLPVLSKEQNNREAMRHYVQKSLQLSAYIIWPLMFGLAGCAEPFVRLILSEKWLPCVPYLRIACLALGFAPFQTANLHALTAMGRADSYLRLELINKTVGIAVILLSMNLGIRAIALSAVVIELVSMAVNSRPTGKLLQYPYWKQMADVLPPFLLAGFMGAIVYCVNFLGLGDIWTLILQVLVGMAVYFVSSGLLGLPGFKMIFSYVRMVFEKKQDQEAQADRK